MPKKLATVITAWYAAKYNNILYTNICDDVGADKMAGFQILSNCISFKAS